MPPEMVSTQRARSFVIRLAVGEDGQWRGQASEPGSADEWHATFSSLQEFWAGLERRLALPDKEAGPPGGGPADPEDWPA